MRVLVSACVRQWVSVLHLVSHTTPVKINPYLLSTQILSAASVIESRVDHERKSNTQITSKLLLDKSHHEKRIDCVLKGFDSAAATSQVDPCTVNGQKLNILCKGAGIEKEEWRGGGKREIHYGSKW